MPASPADAHTAGDLTWGIVTSLPADAVEASDGATIDDGLVRFSSQGLDTATSARFSGTVRFTVHDAALDVSVSDPRVQVDDSTATIVADVATRPVADDAAPPVVSPSVTLAVLTLDEGTVTTESGLQRWAGVPSTLTPGGSAATGGLAPAGQPLGAVGFTLLAAGPAVALPAAPTPIDAGEAAAPTDSIVDGADQPSVPSTAAIATAPPSTAPTAPTRQQSTTTSTADELAGAAPTSPSFIASDLAAQDFAVPAQATTTTFTVVGGAVDWGLRESFRDYVVGPIAHGSIATADGASTNSDGTFRFPVSSGGQAQVDGPVQIRTTGSVRFDGHDGELQITVANVRLEIAGTSGVLYADLTSLPRDDASNSQSWQGIPLADLDLSAVSAAASPQGWVLTNIPARLTAAGVEAFGGFYVAGQPMDPVTVTLQVAETDALPQFGAAPPATTSTTPNASAAGPPPAVPSNALADTGGSANPTLVTVALLFVALGVAAVATRRAADRSLPVPARPR